MNEKSNDELLELLQNCRYSHHESYSREFFDALRKLSKVNRKAFLESLNSEDTYTFYESGIQGWIIRKLESTEDIETRSHICSFYISKVIAEKLLTQLIEEFKESMGSYKLSAVQNERIIENNRNIALQLETFRALVRRDIVNPAITPNIIEYLLGWASSERQEEIFEDICQTMISIIEKANNADEIEYIAVCWTKLMPEVGKRRLRQLFLDAPNPRTREKAKRALILLGESHLLATIGNIGGDYIVGNQTIEIKLGDGNTFHGDFVVAKSIEHSFNKAADADIPDDLKNLLKELASAVGKMSEVLPQEKAQQAARDLETLTSEATSKSPRRKWWELSSQGLKEAAKNVGEIGKPVIDLASHIVLVLSQMYTQ